MLQTEIPLDPSQAEVLQQKIGAVSVLQIEAVCGAGPRYFIVPKRDRAFRPVPDQSCEQCRDKVTVQHAAGKVTVQHAAGEVTVQYAAGKVTVQYAAGEVTV